MTMRNVERYLKKLGENFRDDILMFWKEVKTARKG